jgi:hypothetical protein
MTIAADSNMLLFIWIPVLWLFEVKTFKKSQDAKTASTIHTENAYPKNCKAWLMFHAYSLPFLIGRRRPREPVAVLLLRPALGFAQWSIHLPKDTKRRPGDPRDIQRHTF